ncbi:nucleotide-diphospho-sugar transferase [Teratosphaeria nubilosa]|uniref:Nucleotide-diphospho-sugar transferase n=1 Tax=Teratosphaeria nubilosa TaxID=161662 RepID=A0A6G1KUD4_9PEZI|nr:nucleotide-diphospho-sugar transferase [Teratosphaeria nubilosa]
MAAEDRYKDKLHDSDDWGMPTFPPPTPTIASTPTWSLRRLKKSWPILTLILLLLLLYQSRSPPSRIDKSKHAYVLYAVDEATLCHAYMVFESLHRFNSKADRVLLHNPQWTTTANGGQSRSSELLSRAQKRFAVHLRPVQLLDERGETSAPTADGFSTWDLSITKLRAFELIEYERVLHLDSDITLFTHLDELFLLPKTPLAMPRAYWSEPWERERWGSHGSLTSMVLLIQPNPAEMHGMLRTLREWRTDEGRNRSRAYDMELLNHRFASSAMVLPQRPYGLLTAEFRAENHEPYLGTVNAPASMTAQWDADQILKEAKLVHFSDWPLPKPWVMWPHDGLMEMQPKCAVPPCREREIWKNLYEDFRKRRKEHCRLLSVTAPNWGTWKASVGAD